MRATDDFLLEFLESKRDLFIIPVYQRNYDWKRKNCEKLFDDVINISKKKIESYFVGSIVTYPNSAKSKDSRLSEKLIIDGQQRITTLFLILLALRDYIDTNKLDDYQDILIAIESIILNINDKKLKLKSIKSDDDALQLIIHKKEPEKYISSNILINYNFFLDVISECNISPNDILDSLYKLQIVNITLEKGKDNPQLIFESLNSTGVDLSAADLIRNFLLMELSSEKQESYYFKYWKIIEELNQFKVQNLIRDYLTLKTKKIPKKNDKDLYESFKNFFSKSEKSKEDFLKEILLYSKYYSEIVYDKNKNPEIIQVLKNFKKMEVSVSYPYLLSLWHKLKQKEITEIQVLYSLEIIESFVIRRIICEAPTNALNKIFMYLPYEMEHPKLAQISYEEKLKYCLCRKQSSQRYPNNSEFYTAFQEKEIYKMKPKNKVYILESLENYNNKERVDIEKLLDEKQISIEHIMPQRLNLNWKNDLGKKHIDIHTTFLHRIGNLTLTGYNSVMSNKAFLEKKSKGFADSRFKLNKYINDCEKWTDEQIIERGKKLAEIALERWKYHKTTSSITQNLENETFYELSNSDEFSGKKVKKIVLFGDEFKIEGGHWRTMYKLVARQLYELDPNLFSQLIDDINFGTGNRKFISIKKEDLSRPIEISKLIWLEGNLSASSICKWISYILKLYAWEESELQIYLKEKEIGKNQIEISF